MTNEYSVYLHIGLHKTGTTAFQDWLKINEAYLFYHNISCYRPLLIKKRFNGSELGHAVLRPGVRGSVLQRDPRKREFVGRRLRQQIREAKAAGNAFLISGEDISLIRTRSEAEALKKLLGVESVMVLICIRDKDSWLRSFRKQVEKNQDPGQMDMDGWAQQASKTWMLDFERLIEVMESVFLKVSVLDYSSEMGKRRDIVPALLGEIGVPLDENYRTVVANRQVTLVGRVKRKVRRLFNALRKLEWVSFNMVT